MKAEIEDSTMSSEDISDADETLLKELNSSIDSIVLDGEFEKV